MQVHVSGARRKTLHAALLFFSCSSFVAPISTNKVFNEIRNLGTGRGDQAHVMGFETGYVVRVAWHRMVRERVCGPCSSFRLTRTQPLPGAQLGEPQALFEFVHPNADDPIDNRRQGTCRWVAPDSGMLHGFAGYFDAQLYKDVHISINPPTFSTGMFSWFKYVCSRCAGTILTLSCSRAAACSFLFARLCI